MWHKHGVATDTPDFAATAMPDWMAKDNDKITAEEFASATVVKV